MKRTCVIACLFILLLPVLCFGQTKGPTIKISVDATDAPRKLFHARLTIPATPGTMTLYYPKWIPGEHAPDGPVIDLAGLKFIGNGQTLKWRRDTLDGYAVNVEIPAGVDGIDASLDFLSPPVMEPGFSAGSSATATLAVISWNQLLLYPKGWATGDLTYEASLRLPANWKFGTALPVVSQSAESTPQINFAPVSLTSLVDSPVLAAQFLKVVPLSHDPVPVEMDIAADSAAALDAPPEVWQDYRNLVTQAYALFGAHHYRDYHFLFTLSDHVAHFGLEHHESDDSRIGERGLVDYDQRRLTATLLPHEYVHSWNGKYRRPADLTTPDFEQPMQDDLLWVYEGLTQYLGGLLTARSGLWTPDEYRDWVAQITARLDHEPGRTWRNLQDTADSAAQLYFDQEGWSSWRRTVDFYDEDVLNWLWVDTIIRQQTHGEKSIDDFCHIFHGPPSTGPMVKTYTFDDVVNALNQVTPYDWRSFWTERLTNHDAHAPMTGLSNSGWKVIYDQNPSDLMRVWEDSHRSINASYSIGMMVKDDGMIVDTIEGMPAAMAGIGPGMRLVAVNGKRFAAEFPTSPQVLRDAQRAAMSGKEPIELLIENAGYYRTYKVDYHGGEKYPHLVRDSGPDVLSDIIKEH